MEVSMKKINKNKTVKTLQITGVEYVTPICEWNYLAEISCSHTKGKQKIYELYYLNKNNEIVAHFRHNVPFAAEQLHKDNERLFAVSIASEKYPHRIYRIEKNGTKKLLNMYNNMEFGIEDGCFAVQKGGLWGFIDADGNEIIKPQYEKYQSFKNGYACVKKDRKWGVIDKQNNVVVPFNYHYCKDFQAGISIVVNKNWSKDAINTEGKTLYSAFRFSQIFNLGNGSILVEDKANNKYDIININE